VEDHKTPFVNVVARILVDANDPDDIAEVNRLQDRVILNLNSQNAYAHPDYDQDSFKATKDALLALGKGVSDTTRTFGRQSDVDPVRHLIGTATGWGGLPETEAFYFMETEPRPGGRYTFTLRDMPVDAFWSVSIYNRDGYYEANPFNSYNLNSVTAKADPDGSVILNLAPDGEGLTNHLYVTEGWNYALRLYRPQPAVLDKTWTPPTPQPL
jgi:hypothetical protein